MLALWSLSKLELWAFSPSGNKKVFDNDFEAISDPKIKHSKTFQKSLCASVCYRGQLLAAQIEVATTTTSGAVEGVAL